MSDTFTATPQFGAQSAPPAPAKAGPVVEFKPPAALNLRPSPPKPAVAPVEAKEAPKPPAEPPKPPPDDGKADAKPPAKAEEPPPPRKYLLSVQTPRPSVAATRISSV